MIITPQEREKVLQTFREYPTGLSISDLSIKCGLNRNKCSQIASAFHQKEILGLVQKSSSKIFFLKHQSVLHHLIDAISGPVLVVNESFYVIAANRDYAETFHIDPVEILGTSADQILRPVCPDLIPALKQELGPGMTGRTVTFTDQAGAPCCRTLTVSFTKHQFLIIIFEPVSRQTDPAEASISRAETRFAAAVPALMNEKTWPGAFAQVARLLHETIPEAVIFTLLIDEPHRRCSVHTLTIPAAIQPAGILPEPSADPLPLTEIAILQYKTGEPVTYYTSTLESLQNTPLPDEIKVLCPKIGISSISLMGICSLNSLSSVLGIGSLDNQSPLAYARLLSALSGYLALLCTVCHTAAENRRIQAEYQDHYNEIYTLLTQKTQEKIVHTAEATYLRSFLGSVLHTMQISLIATTPEGALIAANKTAIATYGITGKHLEHNESIRDILPSDLAAELITLLTEKNQQQRSNKPPESADPQTRWYLIRQTGPVATSCLFIGENHPAPLIRYLRSVHGNGTYVPGSELN